MQQRVVMHRRGPCQSFYLYNLTLRKLNTTQKAIPIWRNISITLFGIKHVIERVVNSTQTTFVREILFQEYNIHI